MGPHNNVITIVCTRYHIQWGKIIAGPWGGIAYSNNNDNITSVWTTAVVTMTENQWRRMNLTFHQGARHKRPWPHRILRAGGLLFAALIPKWPSRPFFFIYHRRRFFRITYTCVRSYIERTLYRDRYEFSRTNECWEAHTSEILEDVRTDEKIALAAMTITYMAFFFYF